MGKAVLEAYPVIAEVRLSAPNKHHFLYDLSPFGLENHGEVFNADDRPYGLIEATVTRRMPRSRARRGICSRAGLADWIARLLSRARPSPRIVGRA